jgi:hypothetical protein
VAAIALAAGPGCTLPVLRLGPVEGVTAAKVWARGSCVGRWGRPAWLGSALAAAGVEAAMLAACSVAGREAQGVVAVAPELCERLPAVMVGQGEKGLRA